MMNQYSISLLLILIGCSLACEPTNTSSASPSTTSPNAYFTVAPIKAAEFNQHQGDSLQKLLIQQFCEESKGYQEGTWLGLNKCSWAIEKYRIDQQPDIIQRNGDELSIILKNGSKASFIHKQTESEHPTFFQLKKYFPEGAYALIEKTNMEICPQYIFVRLSDGAQTVLSGKPFFAPDNKNFLLNGGDSPNCYSTLEYWSLSPDYIQQEWTAPWSDGIMEEIKWLDSKTFISNCTPAIANTQKIKYQKFNLLH